MAFRNIAGAAGLVAGIACASCNADYSDAVARSGGSAIPVHVETVAAERSIATLVVPGIVEARSSRSLAFRIGGRIERFRVAEGDRVEAGDAVAELDLSELERSVRAARAAFARAQARRVETQRRYGRQQRLLELAAESPPWLDSPRVESAVHAAEVRYARALLEIAEERLAAGVLRAPVPGLVDRRYRAAGELAPAGSPVARLTELDTVSLRGEVPRVLLPLVQVGGPAAVRSGGLGGRELVGTIESVAASAEPASGSVPFEVRVANRGFALRPEVVAEIAVDVGQREATCAIPLAAVLRGIDAEPFVFVAVGAGETLRIERRKLVLGGLRGDRVAVIAGLAPGSRVVSRGQELVTVGDAVTIVGEGP